MATATPTDPAGQGATSGTTKRPRARKVAAESGRERREREGFERTLERQGLADPLDALLRSFGCVSSAVADRIELAVSRELARSGSDASMVGLRYGKLLLEASASEARLLDYQKGQLLKALEKAVPGEVTQVQVRVRR